MKGTSFNMGQLMVSDKHTTSTGVEIPKNKLL